MMRKFSFLIVFLFSLFQAYAQDRNITGKVVDETGAGMPGATVQVKGTTKGTVTDVDGAYAISVSTGSVLQISYVGYLMQEIAVGESNVIDVTLAPDVQNLDEVVVVGYGIQKKSLVTGSISKINSSEITQSQNLRVEQALQGKTSGVVISQQSGSPGAGMTVRIRGVGTNGNANPLYIVDGIRTGGIDYLAPSDIESIEILKDAASAAIYGSDAANGVVLITTKKGTKGSGEIVYDGYYGIQEASNYMEVMNAEQYIKYYQEAYAWERVNASNSDNITDINDPKAIDNSFKKFPYTFKDGKISKLDWKDVSGDRTAENASSSTDYGQGTDWMKELIEPAPTQKHSLSASGGSNAGTYFLSGGYFNQKGIIGGEQSNYDRYNFRFNGTLNVKEWISFYTNIGYTYKERKWIGENDWFGGDVTSATRLDPLTPVYANSINDFASLSADEQKYLVKNEDGKYYAISDLVKGENANPLASIQARRHDKWNEDKLVGGAGFDFTPIKNLKIHSGIDIDVAHALQSNWDGNYYLSNDIKRLPGSNDILDDGGDPYDETLDSLFNGINLTYQTYKWLTLQNENYITYTQQLGEHNFSVLVGNTIFQYKDLHYATTKPGLYSSDDKWLVYNDYDFKKYKNDVAMWGSEGSDRMLSYYGRLSYNYGEKYMATINFRADGSSKFGPDNKFGYFPSISGGWVISREDFFPQNFVLNFAKLRASYGVNGSNSNLQRWRYLDLLRLKRDGGTERAGVYNPNLRWEKSVQTDIAMDLAFLNNRITFTTDYFVKITKGLLLETSVLASEGEGMTMNAGEITNKGIEFELGFHKKVGTLKYSLGLNGSFMDNEVTSLDQNKFKKLPGANIMGNTVTNFELGFPVWYLYGYKTSGVFQNWEEITEHKSTITNADGSQKDVVLQPTAKPGDIKFLDIASKDENGNIIMTPDGKIDESDKTMIGNPHPDFTFGINANMEFFNFDFSMFWQGVYGNDIYLFPRTERAFYNRPVYMYNERWTGEGSTTSGLRPFSAETVGDNGRPSDFWVHDGSYVRLKQISLGYTIPKVLSSKIKIQKLRMYVSANNILTYTNYPGNDPEIGGDGNANTLGVDFSMYPSAKSYIFGLNIVF